MGAAQKKLHKQAEAFLDSVRPLEAPGFWVDGNVAGDEDCNSVYVNTVAGNTRAGQIDGGVAYTMTSAARPSQSYAASEVGL